MKPEAAVKKAVKDLLNAERIPWWPMQSGKIKSQFGGWVELCAKGTADLLASPRLGFCPMCNDFGPAFLWIEVKAPKGRPSKEQLAFADFVRELNHHHLFVNDVRQLQDWLVEMRAR